MNQATIRNAVRTALMGAASLAVSLAWAQAPEPPTTAPQDTDSPIVSESNSAAQDATSGAQVQQTQIDEQKIDQFADAYVAVQQIQTNAAAELDSAAGDPAKQQATQAKVESEMIAAVERTGLKLDEFNGIVQTMTSDANLRARVVEKIRQRMGG
jgi:hypothetical protein